MNYKKIKMAVLAVSLALVSSLSLADSYTLFATNKTSDNFTLKSGFSSVGTLNANAKLNKFEFNNSDGILFVSNNVPRFTVKYDADNQRPQCFDLFQGYSCDFTKMPGTTSYLLTIEK